MNRKGFDTFLSVGLLLIAFAFAVWLTSDSMIIPGIAAAVGLVIILAAFINRYTGGGNIRRYHH